MKNDQKESSVRGTRSFSTFLAQARKVETAGSRIRSTAHTSSVFVPADIEVADDLK